MSGISSYIQSVSSSINTTLIAKVMATTYLTLLFCIELNCLDIQLCWLLYTIHQQEGLLTLMRHRFT